MNSTLSTCRLCGGVAPLVRSHAIPKALHNDIQRYEEIGQFVKLFSDKFNYQPESKTGIWDRIVCDPCESRFQAWDEYGIAFIRDYRSGERGQLLSRDGKPYALMVDQPNYEMLKLFVISMLWRADANSQSFFHRINLGGKWRSRLSEMLLDADAGESEEFAVLASLFRSEAERFFMADPHPERFEHVNFVRFYVYGGFTFLIKVDQRTLPSPFNHVVLRPNKQLVVLLRDLSPSEKRALGRILK